MGVRSPNNEQEVVDDVFQYELGQYPEADRYVLRKGKACDKIEKF